MLAAALALPGGAMAQADWPQRPIRLLVGFAPGGATDIASRIIAEPLGARLGQPLVIDNRAGAGGIIATEAAARSAPDGYTLLMGTISTHAMNVPLYGARLPYDPVRDFAPVSGVATGPNLPLVHPSLPVTDLAGLIALAKARPGQLTYGSGGNGTSSHLAAEMFKAQAGIDLLHVPFRSTTPAETALVAGQVQVLFDPVIAAMALAQGGQVRPLATSAPQRLPGLPTVPALAETLPGFEMGIWVGLFAPAKTPPAVVARIDAATRAVLALPEVQAKLEGIGAQIMPLPASAFGQYLQAEIARWTEVAQAARITLD
ncbi:Bug family tripartite tricarboxylate transporter substrate binding protein [Dankookia sp. GCM10030260]|uniref:Bug family tripartite tricarboxylate transporter substrate binding protein n=1 Tax=Dankookia sp. GCM10030260 TaxID=3273390 RepID=UPI0036074D75